MSAQQQSLDIHGLFEQVKGEAKGAWRFRWYGLIVAWCLFIVGALITFGLPNEYQASTEVYADTEALMNPLLNGIAVQPNVKNRLQVVTHTLLSRPNLQTIAQQSGLSVRATTPESMATLLDRLARDIDVKSAGTHDLYTVTYRDRSRVMAKKVVQASLQVLMSDTLGANAQSTQTTQSFLQQQVKDYNDKLNKAEAKLAEFEKANIGYIPNQGGSDYIKRLQDAEQDLQTLEDQRSTAVAVRSDLEKQMRGMATNTSSSSINPKIQTIDNEITADQQKRNNLLLRYTEEYPDVVALNRMIVALRKQRQQLQNGAASGSAMEVASDNPVYQDMQKSLYGAQMRIETLATKVKLKKKQIADLKSKVDRLTDVQTTLQRLTRNYDITKKRYNELLSRLETAQISQDASHTGNNLRFQIISPPIVPVLPASPNRQLMIVLVFLMALAGGGGFAFVMHKIKPVFMSLKTLKEFGDYPVLGAISLVTSGRQRRVIRRKIAQYVFGVGLLAVCAGVGFAFAGTVSHLLHHVLGVTIS